MDWALDYSDKPIHSEIIRALTTGGVRVGLVASARRGGKTAMARTIIAATCKDPRTRAWYVAPTYQMARELFFEPFLEDFPRGQVAAINRSELRIDLRNGARIWCKSTERPDSLLGRGLTFICADEFQSMPSNVYDAHLGPLVAETPDKPQGRMLLTGTPRGVGHPFHDMWKKGVDGATPGWQSWLLTAYEANMVPRAQVDALRAEAESRGKTAYKIWRREWMADWDAFVGQVFDAWAPETHVTPSQPTQWRQCVLGMDFGFSESHAGALTAWLRYETDERGRTISHWHCAEEVVRIHETVEAFWLPQVARLATKWRGTHFDERTGRDVQNPVPMLYCDPARPDHIATLRKAQSRDGAAHWHTREAENDVWSGIVTLAEHIEAKRLTVHESCEVLRQELPSYQWEQTNDGALKEKPRKVRDNAVDSARYALHSDRIAHRLTIAK